MLLYFIVAFSEDVSRFPRNAHVVLSIQMWLLIITLERKQSANAAHAELTVKTSTPSFGVCTAQVARCTCSEYLQHNSENLRSSVQLRPGSRIQQRKTMNLITLHHKY